MHRQAKNIAKKQTKQGELQSKKNLLLKHCCLKTTGSRTWLFVCWTLCHLCAWFAIQSNPFSSCFPNLSDLKWDQNMTSFVPHKHSVDMQNQKSHLQSTFDFQNLLPCFCMLTLVAFSFLVFFPLEGPNGEGKSNVMHFSLLLLPFLHFLLL